MLVIKLAQNLSLFFGLVEALRGCANFGSDLGADRIGEIQFRVITASIHCAEDGKKRLIVFQSNLP